MIEISILPRKLQKPEIEEKKWTTSCFLDLPIIKLSVGPNQSIFESIFVLIIIFCLHVTPVTDREELKYQLQLELAVYFSLWLIWGLGFLNHLEYGKICKYVIQNRRLGYKNIKQCAQKA